MLNENQIIDNALEYASGKVPVKLTANIVAKRKKLLEIMPKSNEKAVNEYGEAIIKESMQFYGKALHYLVNKYKLTDSDILQCYIAGRNYYHHKSFRAGCI